MTSTYMHLYWTSYIRYKLHHLRIDDESNINGDEQASILEFELLSIRFVNLYTDFRRSSANVGIPLDINILLAQ